ncbi:tyrosine-type recombinase/integrase [Methylophilus flavus]|uniref:Tyrosine-type recombinase/integrase n=1 Tax=Methylophilus flavus TaxID=640084 RepID=A0ABW3PDT0_9PROT
MEIAKRARKIVLPCMSITETVEATADGAIRISLPKSFPEEAYFVRLKQEETYIPRRLSKFSIPSNVQYNLFPIVLGEDGAPWAEANVYLMSRIMESYLPSMATYSGIANDLAAYRRYLDESGIDWLNFPANKLSRPTYRYSGHLKLAIAAGEVKGTTAKRRMSAIIAFYRWLKSEGALVTAHSTWNESDIYIQQKGSYGNKFSKKVTTTDVSIRVSKQNDPYTETIEDGGKLRPLPYEEQSWLIEALISLGNTEMTLIHLFALLTGARIQTILTFQVNHVLEDLEEQSEHNYELRIPVGPGTNIDTKNDKQLVLHIPIWFYQILRTYALSERARKRRQLERGGDAEDQYLFLSIRGTPLYQSKAELQDFDESVNIRHAKTGQGVRQFITEQVIPFIRQKHSTPHFSYQFHDLRATFGMNLTDAQLELVSKGEVTLHEAREFVKNRMGHESPTTTDRYLQLRKNLKFVRATNAAYDDHLRQLIEQAFRGIQ